jgi:glutamate-ammonia-ligase adenylyltransferase
LCLEHGEPLDEQGRPAAFAIVGMGKLAGREMNYGSDLDVQFVYSSDGATTGGTPNARFFQLLARTVVNDLKGPVLGGSVYALDLRLRPHGVGGPMALSLDAYGNYFDEHGELWERQALLKARPVCGDAALGERFMEHAHAFVYSVTLTPDEAATIRHTRGRKEDKAARETDRLRDVKSGYGCLVDIEFLVQALQLHFGAEDSAIRSQNTVDAMVALRDAGHLSEREERALQESYTFLRFVEDRLQVVDKRSLSALPSDADALDALARRLDYDSEGAQSAGERLLAEHGRQAEAVRCLFDDVFDRLESR